MMLGTHTHIPTIHRGGGIRNTLPESTRDPAHEGVSGEAQFLAQWERVAVAWCGDFEAYRRYVGFLE